MAVVSRVSSAPCFDECGIQGQGLTFNDASFNKLLQEAGHDTFKPLGADAVPEPCHLGGVVGLLVLFDVADHSQVFIVPEAPVEFPIAGDVSQLLHNQRLEDAQWSSGWSFWAFLMVWLGDGLFYVLEVELGEDGCYILTFLHLQLSLNQT